MTRLDANRHISRATNSDQASDTQPGFKPVALPALAAAVRATRQSPSSKPSGGLPAILRKEAMIG